MSSKKSVTLANSFIAEDVRAMLAFHRLVLRGGDARQVAASAPVVKVMRKFSAMLAKQEAFDERKGNGAPCVTSSTSS